MSLSILASCRISSSPSLVGVKRAQYMSIFGDKLTQTTLFSVTRVLVDVKLCPFSGTNEFKEPPVFVALILVVNI